MKRKKGFTVVELVICFVLISIIVIGMLTIALNYRKNARESAIRVTLEEYKVNLTRKIQNDITNLGVNYIKYCDTAVANCIEILFNDGTSKKIEVEALNPTNRYIKYGGEKFMIEDDLKEIENPTLKDVSTLLPLAGIDLSVSFQNNSSIYKIDIPITHTEIEGDYGVHITAFGTGNDPGVYVSTVTFDPTGGSEPNPKTKTVTFKQAYGELPTTIKNYYNFIGWYPTKTSNTKVESTTLVNKIRNHTLYARWSPKSYVVTFEPNGGNTPNPQQKTVTYTKKYGNLAEVSRTGHSFDGWYTASSGGTEITSDNVVNEHKNHTLFAHWTVNDYTVTFNANGGGTPSKSTMEVTYGEQYGELATISRTGYIFNGWYTQASGGTKITSTSTYLIDGNQTLYAHWTANSFTTAAFNIHGYGNELHGQPEDFPNAIDEESERKVVTTLDLSSYTKMTLNIGRFNSDEAVLEHNDGDGSYARIYIGSTRVINANTKVNKDNWAPYSVTVDISKYNGTYTIYKAYYDMNGYSQASNCTLTFE